MKTRFYLLTLAAALATSTLVAANPPAAVPARETVVTAVAPVKQEEPRTIDVDFPGGSIDKLLSAVSKADGMSLSIISVGETPEFAQVELPAFTLRNVNLFTIFQV